MAKDGTNSQKKYRVAWVGKRTGWNYRLDVIPSYNDSNNGSLTVSNEAFDCLNNYEYTPFAYDKYYVGLGDAPSLLLEFDLRRTTSDFAKALCDPFTSYEAVTAFNTDSIFPCHDRFITGNIFELYIEYVGVQSGYELVYRGTQITSLETYENNVLKVETEHIRKTILSQMKFDDFMFLHCFYTQDTGNAELNTTIESFAKPIIGHKKSSIDRLLRIHWLGGGSTQFVGYFDSINSLYGGITNLMRIIEKKMRRLSTIDDYAIQKGLPKHYKQSFLSSGERYTAISEGDIKVLAYISLFALGTINDFKYVRTIDTQEGFKASDGIVNALNAEYESVWDFFQDLAGSNIKKVYFDEANKTLEMNNVYSESAYAIDNIDMQNFEVAFFSDVLGKFTISAIDEHEQGTNVVEYNIVNSRSTDAMEFAAPIHNVAALKVPDKYPYSEVYVFENGATFDEETFSTTVNLCVWYRGNLIDKNGSDFLNNHTASTQTHYIHTHVSPKFEISSTLSSDDYNDVYGYYPYFTDYGLQNGLFFTSSYGMIGGTYYIAAKTLSALFGDKYQTRIETEIQIDAGVYLDTGVVICPFIKPTHYIEFDFTDLEPQTGVFSVIPTKYEFVSVVFDKEERAKVVLLSRVA